MHALMCPPHPGCVEVMTGAGAISTLAGHFIGKAHHGPNRLSQPRRQGLMIFPSFPSPAISRCVIEFTASGTIAFGFGH